MKRLIALTCLLVCLWPHPAKATVSLVNGSFTSQNQSLSVYPNDASTVNITFSGVWSATMVVEGTVDGQNFTTLQMFPYIGGVQGAGVTTISGNGTFTGVAVGLQQIRVRVTTYASGTVTLFMAAASASPPGNVGQQSSNVNVQGTAANQSPAGSPVLVSGAGSSSVGNINNNALGSCDNFAIANANSTTPQAFGNQGTGSPLSPNAGLRYYICGMKAVDNTNSATALQWSTATNSNCTTGSVLFTGGADNFVATGQGETWGNGLGTLFFTPQGTVPCVASTGGAFSISVWISYRLAP